MNDAILVLNEIKYYSKLWGIDRAKRLTVENHLKNYHKVSEASKIIDAMIKEAILEELNCRGRAYLRIIPEKCKTCMVKDTCAVEPESKKVCMARGD